MKGIVFSILVLLAIAVLLFMNKPATRNGGSIPIETQTVEKDVQPEIHDKITVKSAMTDKSESDSIQNPEFAPKEASFIIPEGINRSRFVVAFYDSLCKCPTAIVYDDSKKKRASRIIFYPDGTTDRKKLIPLSASSFGERFEDWPEDKPHYEIYPEIVQYIHTSGSIGATYDVLKVN